MKKHLFVVALFVCLLLPSIAKAADPCTVLPKQSAAVNINSATTTALVPLQANKQITVCGFMISNPPSGTSASTFQFEYGTGAACSSPTVLTGAYGAGFTTAGAPIVYSYGDGGATLFTAPAGNALCLVSAGTTVNLQGVVSYVQS